MGKVSGGFGVVLRIYASILGGGRVLGNTVVN
jgi:hypothetical protein